MAELDRKDGGSFHHLRYVLLVSSGVAMGLMMVMRLSVTVALIGMVNHTQIYMNEHPNATAQEIEDNFQPGYSEIGEFDWNNEMQETIITCYMVSSSVQYRLRLFHSREFILPLSLLSVISNSTGDLHDLSHSHHTCHHEIRSQEIHCGVVVDMRRVNSAHSNDGVLELEMVGSTSLDHGGGVIWSGARNGESD